MDKIIGMNRGEVMCNVRDAHSRHVFPDEQQPSVSRTYINSASLKKEEAQESAKADNCEQMETATLGGGCFWCIEAIMKELDGVVEVVSGYAGGITESPTYEQVCNGKTGHAEVVQVQFHPHVISYDILLRVFLSIHNPTSSIRFGTDLGTHYRSIILYHSEKQQREATQVIYELQPYFEKPIVTEVAPYTKFYRAEERHQQYYNSNPEKAYCHSVITPKLQKMRERFQSVLKK